jgi:hypothetical protein
MSILSAATMHVPMRRSTDLVEWVVPTIRAVPIAAVDCTRIDWRGISRNMNAPNSSIAHKPASAEAFHVAETLQIFAHLRPLWLTLLSSNQSLC